MSLVKFIEVTVLHEVPHDLIEIIEIPGKNTPESIAKCATASREKYFRIFISSKCKCCECFCG